MKKNEIYVVIDTPKKAKKVKRVLDIFGEKINYQTNNSLVEYKMSWLFNENNVPAVFFNSQKVWIGDHVCGIHDRKEVSIKELRNLLAIEHLKEGDVVVCGDNKAVGILKEWEPYFGFELEPCIFLEDGKRSQGGCFDTFIRYATEEEKALLEDKPKSIEAGKWYTCDEYPKFFSFQTCEKRYGFDIFGNWFEVYDMLVDDLTFYRESTTEEVEQALIKEAEKRGYVDGARVKCLQMIGEYTLTSEKHWENFDGKELLMVEKEGTGVWIFKDGKWAEIIEPALVKSSPLTVTLEIKDIATLKVIQKTLKELEEKLTKLI